MEKHHLNLYSAQKYIQLWRKLGCVLDIKDTEYANQYAISTFSHYKGYSNDQLPMLAGFNLEGSNLSGLSESNLVFISVNLNKVNISAQLPYAYFENCDMQEMVAPVESNLSKANFNNLHSTIRKKGLNKSLNSEDNLFISKIPKMSDLCSGNIENKRPNNIFFFKELEAKSIKQADHKSTPVDLHKTMSMDITDEEMAASPFGQRSAKRF